MKKICIIIFACAQTALFATGFDPAADPIYINGKDYYQLLGLKKGAINSKQNISRAYNQSVAQPQLSEKYKAALKLAYDTLIDEASRNTYNAAAHIALFEPERPHSIDIEEFEHPEEGFELILDSKNNQESGLSSSEEEFEFISSDDE